MQDQQQQFHPSDIQQLGMHAAELPACLSHPQWMCVSAASTVQELADSQAAVTHPICFALSSSPMGRHSQSPELSLIHSVPAAVQAVDYAAESGAFAHAFEMCKGPNAQHKLLDVHLKYAMWFEDEGDHLNDKHIYARVTPHLNPQVNLGLTIACEFVLEGL